MLRGTIALSLLCYTCLSEAREISDSTEVKIHSVYVEVLGNGLVGSISYDRILSNIGNLPVSAGLGFFYLTDFQGSTWISIPLRTSILLSGNGKDHIEIGIGTTYVYGLFSIEDEYQSSTLYGSFNLGYRRQKEAGGLFLRVGVFAFAGIVQFSNPPDYWKEYIKDQNNPFPSAGLGIGYTF